MDWLPQAAAWAALALAVAVAAQALRAPGMVAPEGAPPPLHRSSVRPRPPCALLGRRFPDPEPYDLALPQPFPTPDARTCAEACAGLRDCDAWSRSPQGGCQLFSEALDPQDAADGWAAGFSDGREPDGCVGVYR